jgi:hypothetical protein
MEISTKQILKILLVISWVIFVGVCVEAGGFIFNAFFTLVLDPADARRAWQEVDLSALYNYDHGYFFVETLLMSIVAVLRACLFYLIIKMLHSKKLDLAQPFSHEVERFILKITYVTFLIGIFSLWGTKYAEWLVSQGAKMPGIQYLRLGGADVWLFMSVILFVIAQIFKRGIEIQAENDLTV